MPLSQEKNNTYFPSERGDSLGIAPQTFFSDGASDALEYQIATSKL